MDKKEITIEMIRAKLYEMLLRLNCGGSLTEDEKELCRVINGATSDPSF